MYAQLRCYLDAPILTALLVTVPSLAGQTTHHPGTANIGGHMQPTSIVDRTTSQLSVGTVLEITFPTFTPRITLHASSPWKLLQATMSDSQILSKYEAVPVNLISESHVS